MENANGKDQEHEVLQSVIIGLKECEGRGGGLKREWRPNNLPDKQKTPMQGYPLIIYLVSDGSADYCGGMGKEGGRLPGVSQKVAPLFSDQRNG